MNTLTTLLDLRFLDNSLRNWALALLAFTVTFTILPIIKRYVSALAQRASAKHGAIELILRLIPRTSRLFILVVALNAAERLLNFPPTVHRVLTAAIVVGIWYQIGLWSIATVEYSTERYTAHDASAKSSLTVIRFIAGLVVWSLIVLLALDNLDVKLTTLVAGLGVGGIAVALAVQTILGDLLASLSITLDKPFAVGDQLIIDEFQGQVEYIGIKSTRLRSIGGEQIILSNADILKSRIRNFGRMEERRGLLNIGVTYDTPREKLRQVVDIISTAIEAQDHVRLERCHLKNFGVSALEYEAVFFVFDAKVNLLMDVQQAIMFDIFAAFDEQGIEFAYPTQRVLLAKGK